MKGVHKLSKKIIIEMSDTNIKFPATLSEKEEPELCEMFWNLLEKPVKMICQNTLSTGDLFLGFPRPPKHPIKVGSQANPIGRKKWLLSQLDPGMLLFGGDSIYFAYGPHITEPLVAPGSVVAKVEGKYLDDLFKAGKQVWNSQYMTHRLVTLSVSRVDG
jgi:hypothetical protein